MCYSYFLQCFYKLVLLQLKTIQLISALLNPCGGRLKQFMLGLLYSLHRLIISLAVCTLQFL